MVISLVVALALAQPAAQPKGKPGWVVLVHTEGDVPAAWRDALVRAAEENKQQQWVPPPAVTLDEAQLALGCPSFNASCAGQIAGMTGATHALVVDVIANATPPKLALELVRANGKSERDRVTAELPDMSEAGLSWAQELVRGATRNKIPALLMVTTNLPADVSIDGKAEGTTVANTPLRVKVDPGERKLAITGGAQPVNVTITAKPGQLIRETHTLEPKADPLPDNGNVTAKPPDPLPEDHKVVTTTPEPAPAAPSSTSAVVGWSLAGLGGAVALVGGSIYSVAFYNFYLNRVPCSGSAEGCVPQEIMFGLYRDGTRDEFFDRDATVWMSSSAAGFGVGALLIGVGTFVAISEPVEGAE